MQRELIVICLLGSVVLSNASWASDASSAEKANAQFDHYFLVKDMKVRTQDLFFSPLEEIRMEAQSVIEAADSLPLTAWKEVQKSLPFPNEAYDRVKHYGTWIKDPVGISCYNVRSVVLARDSEDPVGNPGTNNCRVDSGRWTDPYTNQVFTNANDLDIDHVVPLRNSYMNGASNWSKAQRCAYGNFLGYNKHLLPVDKSENRRKGDRSPAQYMPPNDSYACEYLGNWLTIKLGWGLSLTPPEAEGILNLIQQHSCSASDLKITVSRLKKIRQQIQTQIDTCEKR